MLWRDGSLIQDTVAPFDHTDRGLTLGDGVFDTALALEGRVAFETAHVARLAASAEALSFPVDPDRITQGLRALAPLAPRLAIRTTATRGVGPRGVRPPAHPAPVLFASAAVSSPAIAFAPLRLWPTAIARNETSPAARLKTLGYLDAVLGASEAATQGFDEALFCNTQGRVACAGTGNLFAVFGATLVTPPGSDGVLAGIVRGEILALGGACDLQVSEHSLTLPEFLRADAVFLTNSLRLLAPIQGIGAVGFESRTHPAIERLSRALRAAVARACGVAPDRVS